MPDKVPTVISTFSGCGGSSFGYQLAGFKVRLAVEWDKHAAATYRANFPDTPLYVGDICKLSADECAELSGLELGELDVFDGSPPCQGFSTAGKRDFGDDRNQLFREYVRLMTALRPKAFVLENVAGMVKGKMRLIFVDMLKELKVCGYRVKARVLNAMYYNVPQSRNRVIVIGMRSDLGIEPRHPKPNAKVQTVRQAIGHLPIGVPGQHKDEILQAWHRSKGNQSLRKVDRFVGSFQSVRLDADSPSVTQIRSHLNWHYSTPRQLTIQEAGLIHSFYERFKWVGIKTANKEQIGNSVPPNFMRAIAECIKGQLANALEQVTH